MIRTQRLAVLTILLVAPAAQAQMLGEVLDADWRYPSFTSVLESHTVTVTNAVELPSTTIVSDFKFDIDIGDDWIEFRFNDTSNWTGSNFNGWWFHDSLGTLPVITGYSVVGSSAGIGGEEFLVPRFDDDSVWADFGGLTAGAGDWIRLEVSFGGPGTAFCFGDQTDTLCPCGNLGAPEEGCQNSSGAGAALSSDGTSSSGADDLLLVGSQLPPGVPALFFAGDVLIAPGMLFGDGLRCAGGGITRLEVVMADSQGSASTSIPIASTLGATPGARHVFQLWYRDVSGPCNTGFNTSGAIDLTWM